MTEGSRRLVVTVFVLTMLPCAGRPGAAQVRGVLRASGKSCTITAINVAFGRFDPQNTSPTDSQGSVTYVCGQVPTRLKAVRTPVKNVRVEIGRGSSGSFDRAMTVGGTRLRYNLYLDPTRQLIWGDGSGGTEVLRHDSPKNGQPYTVPIYARIFPLQDVVPGAYGDGLVVTIEWE